MNDFKYNPIDYDEPVRTDMSEPLPLKIIS